MMRNFFLYFAIVGVCYCATTTSPPPKNQPTTSAAGKPPIIGPANSTSSVKVAPPPKQLANGSSSSSSSSSPNGSGKSSAVKTAPPNQQPTNRLSSSSNVAAAAATPSAKKSAPSGNVLLQSRLGSSNNGSELLQTRLGSSSNVKIEIANRLGYVYKNKTSAVPNRIITTRFGGQCQCISYHLCDKKDVYLTDPNDESSTVSCDNQYQTCCNIPAQPLTSSPIYTEDTLSSTVSNPSAGGGTCVCVSVDRCNDQSDIASIINPKIPCSSGEICCSSVAGEPSVNVPNSSTDSNSPSDVNVNPTDPPAEFTCVPSYMWCSNISLTNNYGFNVIMEKVTPCPPTQYYCPTIDVIVPPNAGNDHPTEVPGGGDGSESGVNNGDGNISGSGAGTGSGSNNGVGNTNTGTNVGQISEDYVSCGYRRLSNEIGQKITGLQDPTTTTTFGEFPWMALIVRRLGDRDSVVCGASVVTHSVVLTAAHCVNKIDQDSIFVRVGEYDTFVDSDSEPRPHQDRTISEIIIHPAFRPGILFNDFAVIVLTTNFEFTTNVAPICLPLLGSTFDGNDIYDPNQCIATGWGKNAYNATAQYQNTLRKVDLRLIEHNDCEQRLRTSKLGANFKLDPSFICAVGENGKDTCQGDGGGPLFCAMRDTPYRYIQVGIISWGIGCGNEFPGVYASLHSVEEWLTTEFNTYNQFMVYTRIKV